MGDSVREQSDDDQEPREELLVEYQEETQLEIQHIKLEAVTPAQKMAYIHGAATNMTVFIENAQHPLIIESGAHFSIVPKDYLDSHFPNLEKQLFPNRTKFMKNESGKMTSIGKIFKEITIPHRKGNIRLNPEFFVLDDAHI
ncbi:hypothetical protein O181_035320 [Austropuccinia psidii MF-1]|uniref:Uncharacterized protein n=1 Tax=Austropuccinia psidii MF-1 TaxID=1389203 RepID=A0A9Q3D6N4_9BASI|nr:hypothetical protein [Austropuccinia psidii MF-1]